jgi:peptidoglycan/xylan/chitin deacetylase (PgdA/CDA1 family)
MRPTSARARAETAMRHLATILLALASLDGARAADEAPRIAKWQGDRAGAFALTFDDGQREQVVLAAPMLDALGLKATFVINPGKTPATAGEAWFASWDEWRALAKNGHEIGNHSLTHQNFTTLAADKLEEEIVTAQQRIEQEIGKPCITFCYPFNAETPAARVVVRRTHAVSTSGERKAYGGPQFAAAKANAWVDEAIAKRDLVIAMIHGIDTGYLPFAGRAVLKDHLEYLKSREAEVWIAPIGTIGRYRQEREAAVLDAKAGDHQATFTLACPLEPRVYAIPLTVVIAGGAAPQAPAARREGASEPLAVSVHGDAIHCEVVPGPGVVTVTWK